jgi:hypothetical protein
MHEPTFGLRLGHFVISSQTHRYCIIIHKCAWTGGVGLVYVHSAEVPWGVTSTLCIHSTYPSTSSSWRRRCSNSLDKPSRSAGDAHPHLFLCFELLFHVREHFAGPRMISRLERKSLLVRGSVSLFFMQSLPLYNNLQRRYMLGRFACQHTWLIVMCSMRTELCFIHICPLSLHPYRLSHVSHVLFCIRPECVTACICMY